MIRIKRIRAAEAAMDKFEVVSPYKPTGDQPAAIESIADGIENGLRHQAARRIRWQR